MTLKQKKRMYFRAWYKKNKKKRRLSQRAYYKKHPELFRKSRQKYYRSHRQACLAMCRKYRQTHLKRVNEMGRLWRLKNPEKARKNQLRGYLAMKRRYHADPKYRAAVLKTREEWRKKNKERWNRYQLLSRVRAGLRTAWIRKRLVSDGLLPAGA